MVFKKVAKKAAPRKKLTGAALAKVRKSNDKAYKKANASFSGNYKKASTRLDKALPKTKRKKKVKK